MKKAICIFVSKNSKPDLYINILGYCFARFGKHRISRVYLLNVFDFALEREEEEKKLNEIEINIKKQLQSLIKSSYKPWLFRENTFDNQVIPIKVNKNYINIYINLNEIITEREFIKKSILFEELDSELKLLLQQSFGEYIFDITGLINRYMIEVSLFLMQNEYSITSFEMLRKLTHNENDLIHNLKKEDFDYLNLSSNSYKVSSRKNYIDESKSSNDSNLFERWIRQIGNARTENVIEEIRNYSLHNKNRLLLDQMTSISQRWNKLKKDNLDGIVSRENFITEINAINEALRGLIFDEFDK